MNLQNGSRAFIRDSSYDWMTKGKCARSKKFIDSTLKLDTKIALARVCLSCPVLEECRSYRRKLEAAGKMPQGVVMAGKVYP